MARAVRIFQRERRMHRSTVGSAAAIVAAILASTPALRAQASTSFEKVNICTRVPGEAVAAAVSGKLLETRPVNIKDFAAARCIYGIEIGGARRMFAIWISAASEYEGLRNAADGPVTPIAGVGDKAHQTFDNDSKRYWLRAVQRDKVTVEVSGDRPEWLQPIARLALSKF
jgi:hypothetical protein